MLRYRLPFNGDVVEPFGLITIGIKVFSHGVTSYLLIILTIPSFDCNNPKRVPTECTNDNKNSEEKFFCLHSYGKNVNLKNYEMQSCNWRHSLTWYASENTSIIKLIDCILLHFNWLYYWLLLNRSPYLCMRADLPRMGSRRTTVYYVCSLCWIAPDRTYSDRESIPDRSACRASI